VHPSLRLGTSTQPHPILRARRPKLFAASQEAEGGKSRVHEPAARRATRTAHSVLLAPLMTNEHPVPRAGGQFLPPIEGVSQHIRAVAQMR